MVFFLFIPLILYYIIRRVFRRERKSVENKHVFITGGSSGIGKSLAVLCAKEGAHVTIAARNPGKLNVALAEIKQACVREDQRIQSISVDVSDFTAVNQKINEVEEAVGSIYMLVNCAGLAICGKLEDLSVEDIRTQMDINFFGTVYPIKTVVPKMKQRKEGIIVITASQAALVGIFGMSVYCGSKFALRGFAEGLDMELHGSNVGVTLALPPDTDTPGFENENKSKPIETSRISESGGLFQPDVVAKQILNDALAGKFLSTVGFESFITTTLCVGMTRFSSIIEVVFQAFLLGPLRIIGCFYLSSFHKIIKNAPAAPVDKNK